MENFETKLARLEEIVGRLEDRDVALAEALTLFEEGVRIVRELDGLLHGARGKIEELMKSLDVVSLNTEDYEHGDDHPFEE